MMVDALIFKVREALSPEVNITDEVVMACIHQEITKIHHDKTLSLRERTLLFQTAFNAIRRLDVIQPLIDDPTISEIMVNGPHLIFIERAGRMIKTDIQFDSTKRLMQVIQKIVSDVDRMVNEATPIVDARLPDGSRVHAILPPLAIKGPILTIRKFHPQTFALKDLVENDTMTQACADFLKGLVRAKYNIFISGSTGSGKTTLLNCLAHEIPPDERLVTIEDSAELKLDHIPNLVSLETRNANTQGAGEVTIKALIKASLRMRPDRIIVGEVRGGEALDMLQAMNTGHDGSLSTGHANNGKDMLKRLETMVYSDTNMPLNAIRQQIISGVEVLVHVGRMPDRSRKLISIEEVIGIGEDAIVTRSLFERVWQSTGSGFHHELVCKQTDLKRFEKWDQYVKEAL